MPDAAAALAAPTTVTHQGKTYPLHPLTLDDAAMFERWAENRAFDAISVRRGQIDETDYTILLRAWLDDVVAGKYRFGSPLCSRLIGMREGASFLFFLMLAKGSPGMTPKLASEIFDAEMAQVKAKMEAANTAPLADTGAAAATPTPE